jgi:23S rRNA (cytosine1962-C5)-methyltransferase
MQKIVLKPGKDKALLRKHPWIFSGAIAQTDDAEDGDMVMVTTKNNTILGYGHYQSHGSIRVRMLSFGSQPLPFDFWQIRFQHALELRTKLGLIRSDNQIFRLIHGEGDGLPSLIIDIYGPHAVVQPHSSGMVRSLPAIVNGLKSLEYDLETIYIKHPDKNTEHLDEFALGTAEETIALENGVPFKINWVTGQKTGFFIDQRENRKLLGELCAGKTVLNLFAYSGGFSMYALKKQATRVISVDVSQRAVDLCLSNAQQQNAEDRHIGAAEDVLEYLRNTEETFDIVIVDPPAYAKSLKKKHSAVQGYKRLNAAAFKKVKKGGFMLTFSCSQVVDRELFYNTITAAGIDAGVEARVLGHLSQGPDHPVNLFHPEGSYLKGLWMEVN